MSAAIRSIAVVALVPLLAGQQPTATLRITVTLVQVDAVVTDSQGRHVPDLRRENFELLQDGEPQNITYFAYVPGEPPATADNTLIRLAPVVITPSQIKRTIALVVDDLALSFQSLVRVREGLKKYVNEQMQTGDLVALIRTGGGVAILEQFTTDRRILLEAIDLLKWKFPGRVGLLSLRADPQDSATRNGPEILDYGYTLSALGSLRTIEEVVQGMKRFPGRKSLVFFSDSLAVNGTIGPALEHVTDLANRAAVSIYTVDPGGLRTRQHGADEDPKLYRTPADTPPNANFPPVAIGEEVDFQSDGGLRDLAARTGGLFLNSNDLARSVTQAADDQAGYYFLGYTPKEGTFDKNPARARFHKIVVRVARRGLHVRWKSGFNGVADEPEPPEVTSNSGRQEQILDALASPFQATGIKVKLTSVFTETHKTGPAVFSMLHFGGKDLAFTRDDEGVWHASVDIVTSAWRGVKQKMQQRERVQDIALPDDMYQRAQKEGFLINLLDKMQEPGTFLMRAIVRDRAAGRVGSATQVLHTPDTRKGRLALSGVLLKLAENPDAKPQDGVEEWSEGNPAVRRYHPGQNITYGYLVINAKKKGSAEPNLVLQTRLYRNGALVYTGKPSRDLLRSEVDPSKYIGGGQLHINPQAPTGEYLVQVTVTDEGARKKSQISEWADFEVVPTPALQAAAPTQF